MQRLEGRMRAAIQKYDMISAGDKIAVGVSGGKDSLALLAGLAALSEYYPQKFTLKAISLNPCFGGKEGDFSAIAAYCESIGVDYTVKRTHLGEVVFEQRNEKNPCSLCAKMRRGALHNMTKELGCNKLALGHHMDDAAETFMMNLLSGGRADCFSPVTYLSEKDITLIRPMIYAREDLTASAAKRAGLPVRASGCPMDGVSERQRVKELLSSLEKTYPALREKIVGALEKGEIDGWRSEAVKNDQ